MGRPTPPMVTEVLERPAFADRLEALYGDRVEDAPGPLEVRAERLGRRVIRCAVGPASGDRRLAVIAKVYDGAEQARRADAALRALRDSGFCEAEPRSILVPEPLGLVEEQGLVLMEEVAGVPLKHLVKKGDALGHHMRLFGQAAAKLHAWPLAFGRPFTVDDHLRQRCAGLVGALGRREPALDDAIDRVVSLARAAEDPRVFSLIHGDFHLGQAHVDVAGDRLWLLDLDPLCWGDPAYDLAMALVVLKRLEAAAERPERRDYLSMLRDEFLDAYFAGGSWTTAARVPIHEALIHLKRACKRFRYQDEPGWQNTVRRQIGQTAACIEVMARHPAPRNREEVVEMQRACPGGA